MRGERDGACKEMLLIEEGMSRRGTGGRSFTRQLVTSFGNGSAYDSRDGNGKISSLILQSELGLSYFPCSHARENESAVLSM